MNETIKQKLKTLPEKPGSYQMLSANGTIIYVGKAKNLKSRVRSYFVGSHDQKTQHMVSEIDDFRYIITPTEKAAFLLELSLIKEHQPKYNILLMDDKTYPYIEITDETHPRLTITRNVKKRHKNLFGPFPDAHSARKTMNLLNRIFPLRKCRTMPDKVCLYYHIGQCLAPCAFAVDQKEYDTIIKKIRRFLSGRSDELRYEIEEAMHTHADNMEYEKAQEKKELLQAIEETTEQQQIIFSDLKDRDIFSFATYDRFMAVTVLFMRRGRIIFSENKIMTYYAEAANQFLAYLAQFYENKPLPSEILVPEGVDYALIEDQLEARHHVPRRGQKTELTAMARENAENALQNDLKAYLNREKKTLGATEALGELLNIDPPTRIDAFDNSHTMGSNQVAAMVVFKNGIPDKKNYRKYHLNAHSGQDDIAGMHEVIHRRYERMIRENDEYPDLIVIDGGFAQKKAAEEEIHALYLEIPVIGLKKDDKHRTDVLITPGDNEVTLDRHGFLYVLLTKIQDEVHRFAITFHRSVQKKQIYGSILDAIPKIGKKTKQKLLRKYKTIENIKKATDDELKQLRMTKPAIENLRVALRDYKLTK